MDSRNLRDKKDKRMKNKFLEKQCMYNILHCKITNISDKSE